MTTEELARFVDRQKEISLRARESIDKALKSLDINMIFNDRAKARTRFISAVVKNSDKYLTESLRNGRELKKVKLA